MSLYPSVVVSRNWKLIFIIKEIYINFRYIDTKDRGIIGNWSVGLEVMKSHKKTVPAHAHAY